MPQRIQSRMRRRRDFLRLGALGGAGLCLPALLRATAARASVTDGSFGRAKRCILVFLNGGPSQLDLWDMKPDAPAEIRGELKPIPTAVPGIQISELLPLLAQQADKYKIVRSVTHPCSVHTTGVYTMLTGTVHRTPLIDQIRATSEDHPHLGCIVARWRGWQSDLPPFVSLPSLFKAPPVEGIWPGQNAGFLGPQYDPFVVSGDRETAEYTPPSLEPLIDVNPGRLQVRRALLEHVNKANRNLTPALVRRSDLDTYYEKAFSLLTSPSVQTAFDLSREPASVRERYGQHLFGQGVLLARRMIEAGVPLVTVYWNDPTPPGPGGGEYDSHGRIYHHMRNRLVPPTDRALASLFDDMSGRGLLEDTLVIVMGEFGRTPRLNKDAGRDHWPQVQSILLAGAGITGGSVFGSSDRIASAPASNPISPPDLAQTVLHLLGVPASLVLEDQQDRPLRACGGTPVPGLYA